MIPSDDLSTLLQSWVPELADPHDFNRGVWSRVEAAESCKNILGARITEFLSFFARPRIAVTAAAIALFGGVFLGNLHARSAEEEQYLSSLNPYSASSSHDQTREPK